jgi:hypothetical protein
MRFLTVRHIGTSGNTITIKHESASSTAANRFNLPGAVDLALSQRGAAWFLYNANTDRWEMIGATASAGGGVGGSGTTNQIPKFTAGTTLGDSSISDNGTTVSTTLPISTSAAGTAVSMPSGNLSVGGNAAVSGATTTNTLAVNSTSTFTGNITANGSNTLGNDNADDQILNGSVKMPDAHKRRLEIHEEMFDCHANTTGGRIIYSFSGASSAVLLQTAESNHPAVCLLASGSTTTGRASAIMGGIGNYDPIRLGGGELLWEVLAKIDTLCDATDDCVMRCGLLDDMTATPNDGVYFEYDRAITTSWRVVTANAGTRTAQTTSPAQTVAAGSWFRLEALVNAGNTSVTFYYNGTAVGTITTNLMANPSGFGCTINKRAGTTAKYMYVDYLHLTQGFTTQR